MTSQKFPLEQVIAIQNQGKREKNHFYARKHLSWH